MTIKTKITVAGTEVDDYQNLRIIRSTSKQGMSSRFNVVIDSPAGRHNDDFVVGNEIQVFVDKDAAPTTNIFTGIVEEVNFEGKESTQVVILRGRDYTARLMDVTVKPVVYTNSEVSTIVTNIIDNEVDDITTTNVDVTDTTLVRIAFNHEPVYDALKKLAELSGFIFYIDENKDLHFEKEENISSEITLDNTNIQKSLFDKSRQGMANIVWVYGDRQLVGVKEVIASGAMTNGSVLTLLNKPHNTQVETSSFPGSILKGGILDMMVSFTSGPDYLVDFQDRQIVFVSGTSIGYNTILSAGGSAIINYSKTIPIVKFGQNRASIRAYGPKEDVILDKTIKDPNTAKDVLIRALEDSDPLDKMEINIKGWFTFNPGDTVIVNMPDFNLDNRTVAIIEIVYDFDKNKIQSESVIKVRIDNKVFDVTDKIRDLSKRIDAIEATEKLSTDNLTRLEQLTGSLLVVGSYWVIQTSSVTGSQYHLYGTGFTPPINPFHVASGTDQGALAGSYTGSASAFGPLVIITSGGYSY